MSKERRSALAAILIKQAEELEAAARDHVPTKQSAATTHTDLGNGARLEAD